MNATNIKTEEQNIFLNIPEAPTLELLRDLRLQVERRGVAAEYLELADMYAAIGATANADALRRKAHGMRIQQSQEPAPRRTGMRRAGERVEVRYGIRN